MSTIRNAAPRPILQGINDVSGRTPVYEAEQIPTHLPHVFLFTERGPTLPQLVIGDKMTTMYGAKSFDPRGKYTNHQTMLANVIAAEGNQLMVQRVLPPGTKPPAGIRLSVDVSKDRVPVYQRDATGKFALDGSGNKVPTGATTPGYILRWIAEPLFTTDSQGKLIGGFGESESRTGTFTSATNQQSSIYPIMDIQVQDIGEYGNRMGVVLYAPTSDSAIAADVSTIEKQNTNLFRIAFVERDAASGSVKTLESLFGEKYIDFSFKPGAINESTEKELYYEAAVIPSFTQEPVGGRTEIRSPIGGMHIYEDYLNDLLQNLYEAENGEDNSDKAYMMNPFSGVDYNNIPYDTIRIAGPSENGKLFTPNTVQYFQGGADGDLSFKTFDDAVAYECKNYGELDAKVLDPAVYPQSVIYDSGFTLETKKALAVPLGRRKDIGVILATQDVSRPQNTPSEESSIAVALRTLLRMYPESEVYGTSVCRGLVVSQAGWLLGSNYKGLLPLTLELAQKFARYMGAGSGVWSAGNAFDFPPNNQISMFKGVNAQFRSVEVRANDWDMGLVWAQNYDRRTLFFPGIQTVYEDDSSVLNSAANMFIAIELEKVAQAVWRDLAGISSLTEEQFIERSNSLILDRTRARFDNRVVIEPETFLTEADTARGYSWSCNIHMYAPNMRTVGTFTVVAHRSSDL